MGSGCYRSTDADLAGATKLTVHQETYYDFSDFRLLARNLWLRKKGPLKQVLKDYLMKTDDANLPFYYLFTSLTEIEALVSEWDQWRDLRPYASFKVHCIRGGDNAPRIDLCQFSDNDYIGVGTWSPQQSDQSRRGTAAGNSKIIEYRQLHGSNLGIQLESLPWPVGYNNKEQRFGHSTAFPADHRFQN